MNTTHRGFSYLEFEDSYGQVCSIQKSSIATEDCIWLGLQDANPIIMASHASKFGVETSENCGWIPYPTHEDVNLHTRMHLSIDNVKELIPLLQKFVDTGDLSD